MVENPYPFSSNNKVPIGLYQSTFQQYSYGQSCAIDDLDRLGWIDCFDQNPSGLLLRPGPSPHSMHIVTERSNGLIRSNCNILALAWMPHYDETAFRRSHMTYQQRLLAQLAEPLGYQLPLEPSNGSPRLVNEDANRRGLQDILRGRAQGDHIRPAGRNGDLGQLIKARAYSNSRLIEQLQRFLHTRQSGTRQPNDCDLNATSNTAINDRIDELYGKMDSFGWLAIGNIGKMVGVTLTSTTEPPIEIEGRRPAASHRDDVDLIDLSETTASSKPERASQSKQAQSDGRPSRPDRAAARTNFNLRGHLDEVILVKWNEIYQKLASVDSKGNVLIWSKSNGRFTIQTPFYSKSKSVADFRWSNDGKTALICYTDSFILVGSSFSQRHWHSMLNLEDYHITCATWTPDDEQLLLGVSNGNIILIDLPTSELTELAVSQANIRTMCWSSGELNLRQLSQSQAPPPTAPPGDQKDHSGSLNQFEPPPNDDTRVESRRNVVNRRRLSLNCALFCRNRPPSSLNDATQRNSDRHPKRPASATKQRHPIDAQNLGSDHREILAIDFADNTIKLFDGGLSDPKPRQIQVQLESYLMAWSSDGRILAVAGFNIYTSTLSVGCLRCKYLNAIKFYNREGLLIHERRVNFTRYPITALTWAHNDRRLFVATGPRLHCAKVFMGVPKLSLLSLSCLYRNAKLMSKSSALMSLAQKQFVPGLLNWQSHNCPIEIELNAEPRQQRRQQPVECNAGTPGANSPPVTTETGLAGGDDRNNSVGVTSTSWPPSGGAAAERAHLLNNVNICNYQLPAKLKSKIDQLFAQTTRQPFDEQFTLDDIVWHVPKNQRRIHCTLVCYTHELLDAAGCLGFQYKAQETIQTGGAGMAPGSQQRAKSNGSSSSSFEADLQFKIFVLYVEFQGSLVPILKARRVGFLKPEFVLFDPEPNLNGSLQRYYKVSDIYQHPGGSRGPNSSPCAELHGAGGHMGNLSPLLTPRQSSAALQARTPMARRLDASRSRIVRDPHLLYLLNLSQQQRLGRDKRSPSPSGNELVQKHELMRAIERQRLRSLRAKLSGSAASSRGQALCSGQSGLRSLPETSELIRIKSNIWGTKFKLINASNKMTDRRAVLGSVRYKASLLHLQPRQIHLSMKDMSNYCVLCSVHHHTKMLARKRSQTAPICRDTLETSTTSRANPVPMSLMDLPLASSSTPLSSNSGRPSRHRHKPDRERAGQSDGGEKLALAVGDTIRVVPQLEPNQRYKLADRSSSLSSVAQSKPRPLVALTPVRTPASVQSHGRRHDLAPRTKHATRRLDRATSSKSTSSRMPQAEDRGEQTETARDDDILTISIGQGDQVELEMSSENRELNGDQAANSSRPSRSHVDEQGVDEFLRANKTLKSIKTITSMIVDLSVKAQEAVEASRPRAEPDTLAHSQPSPSKMLKIENASGISQRSPSRAHYIPPETPVHRPRRHAAHIKGHQEAQSMTSSPSASRRNRLETRQATVPHSLDPNDSLPPPPPPSVPFRRRLSISAKRLIDGSLRSLSSLGANGASGSYLTGDEADTEDCEVLVTPRRHRKADKWTRLAGGSRLAANRHQSQPCTPLRSSANPSRRPTIDLAQLRSQVVEKLRLSSSWMSPARCPSDSSARREARSSARQQHDKSASCTKRSNWILRGQREETSASSFNGLRGRSLLLSSSNSSSSSDLSASSSTSSSSSASPNSIKGHQLAGGDFSFLNKAARTELLKRTSRLSSSVKEFSRLAGGSNSRNADERRQRTRPPTETRRGTKSRRSGGKKSICSSSNCCCGREFKLSNRPPVWNELSQVYQLDFGGRVTQESAKNLQIDFNGSLALQFGRIDKCTYTLDYQFPFNAVQAMSIALASLTQRLK